MKFQVQIFAKDGGDFTLLDLFEDQSIQVKSSQQDINDIAMVFTDFSQTFTIPATKTNNAVFKHYYNNDLDEFNLLGIFCNLATALATCLAAGVILQHFDSRNVLRIWTKKSALLNPQTKGTQP